VQNSLFLGSQTGPRWTMVILLDRWALWQPKKLKIPARKAPWLTVLLAAGKARSPL